MAIIGREAVQASSADIRAKSEQARAQPDASAERVFGGLYIAEVQLSGPKPSAP